MSWQSRYNCFVEIQFRPCSSQMLAGILEKLLITKPGVRTDLHASATVAVADGSIDTAQLSFAMTGVRHNVSFFMESDSSVIGRPCGFTDLREPGRPFEIRSWMTEDPQIPNHHSLVVGIGFGSFHDRKAMTFTKGKKLLELFNAPLPIVARQMIWREMRIEHAWHRFRRFPSVGIIAHATKEGSPILLVVGRET